MSADTAAAVVEESLTSAAIVGGDKTAVICRHIGLALFQLLQPVHQIAVRVEEVGHRGDEVDARGELDEHGLQGLVVFVRLEAQLEAVEPLVTVLVDGDFLGLKTRKRYL